MLHNCDISWIPLRLYCSTRRQMVRMLHIHTGYLNWKAISMNSNSAMVTTNRLTNVEISGLASNIGAQLFAALSIGPYVHNSEQQTPGTLTTLVGNDQYMKGLRPNGVYSSTGCSYQVGAQQSSARYSVVEVFLNFSSVILDPHPSSTAFVDV